MLEYIRNELLGMTDKGEYAAFTSSLIPGCDNMNKTAGIKAICKTAYKR